MGSGETSAMRTYRMRILFQTKGLRGCEREATITVAEFERCNQAVLGHRPLRVELTVVKMVDIARRQGAGK
jgi:hypothetical protein